jgi:hypothetical protein
MGFPGTVEVNKKDSANIDVPLRLRVQNHSAAAIVFCKRMVDIDIQTVDGAILSGKGNDHTFAFTRSDFVSIQAGGFLDIPYECKISTSGTAVNVSGQIAEFFWRAEHLGVGRYQVRAEYDLAGQVAKGFKAEKGLLDEEQKEELYVGKLDSPGVPFVIKPAVSAGLANSGSERRR